MKNHSKRMQVFVIAGLLALGLQPGYAQKWPKAVKGIKVFAPPEDLTVWTNGTAYFTVIAEPAKPLISPPLAYQWLKNGTNLPGETYATLMITNAQVTNVGFYSCVLTRGSSTLEVKSVDTDAPGARLFVLAGTNTDVSGPIQPGTGTKTCVGAYKGWVTFKNASNSTWWTPPAGSTNCTITDLTRNNYSPPYIPVVQWVDNTTLASNCATNTVSFSVNTTHKYQFTTFIKNTMPPPNSGDSLGLNINWQ